MRAHLMVLFRYEERELRRVHDEDQGAPIRVVAAALGERQLVPVGLARVDQPPQVHVRPGPSREAHQVPVLRSPVAGLVRAVPVLVEEPRVDGGEVRERPGGDAQSHHLGVSQRPVVGDALPVVVAHLAVEGALPAAGVARARGDLGVGATEEAALGFHELVLHLARGRDEMAKHDVPRLGLTQSHRATHMPKAPASEVDLDLSVVAIAGVSEGAGTREGRRRGHGEERVAAEVAARLDRRRLVAVGAVPAHANGCGSERPALDAEGRGAAGQDQT